MLSVSFVLSYISFEKLFQIPGFGGAFMAVIWSWSYDRSLARVKLAFTPAPYFVEEKLT